MRQFRWDPWCVPGAQFCSENAGKRCLLYSLGSGALTLGLARACSGGGGLQVRTQGPAPAGRARGLWPCVRSVPRQRPPYGRSMGPQPGGPAESGAGPGSPAPGSTGPGGKTHIPFSCRLSSASPPECLRPGEGGLPLSGVRAGEWPGSAREAFGDGGGSPLPPGEEEEGQPAGQCWPPPCRATSGDPELLSPR